MTLVPVPFRRRLPLVQPDLAVAVLLQTDPAAPVTRQPPTAPPAPPTAGGDVTEGSGMAPQQPPSSTIPPRWAVALVALVLLLASALIGLGHPISIVLEVLAGAGYLGVELVRQLNRELQP